MYASDAWIRAVVETAVDAIITIDENSKIIYAKSLPQAARTHKGHSLMSIKGKDRLTRLVILRKVS